MSAILLPERTNSSPDLQSWRSQLKPNHSESFHSATGKENLHVSMYNHTSSSSRVTPFKPVNRGFEPVDKPRIKAVCLDQEDTVSELDNEIEEIESEIRMLRSRLQDLRLQKATSSLKFEERNRIDSPERRIVSLRRRGLSMGPTEIVGAVKSNQFGRREIASPVLISRRKSCFLKLENTDHENAVKSLSVPSRRLKKGDGKLSEKSVLVANKKAMRPARVVASRYNQKTSQKPSLEENDVESSGVKKLWEFPSEIVLRGSKEDELSVVGVPYLLPRIKTVRFVDDNRRDSGPAKRVADLVGKKSFFADDDVEAERSVYQTFRFDV